MIKIGIECGQRVWKLRSWRNKPRLRRIDAGFAVGPIMVWRRNR